MPDIPMADVSIRVASSMDTKDEVFFLQTLGLILLRYSQLSVDDYWRLTCTEHAALLLAVDPKGRVKRGE